MKTESKNFLDTNWKSNASLISKDFLNEEATYELNKIVEIKSERYRDYLIYKTGNKNKDETIRSFEKEIYNKDLLLIMMMMMMMMMMMHLNYK